MYLRRYNKLKKVENEENFFNLLDFA
jgi:hypothetical protein